MDPGKTLFISLAARNRFEGEKIESPTGKSGFITRVKMTPTALITVEWEDSFQETQLPLIFKLGVTLVQETDKGPLNLHVWSGLWILHFQPLT